MIDEDALREAVARAIYESPTPDGWRKHPKKWRDVRKDEGLYGYKRWYIEADAAINVVRSLTNNV